MGAQVMHGMSYAHRRRARLAAVFARDASQRRQLHVAERAERGTLHRLPQPEQRQRPAQPRQKVSAG